MGHILPGSSLDTVTLTVLAYTGHDFAGIPGVVPRKFLKPAFDLTGGHWLMTRSMNLKMVSNDRVSFTSNTSFNLHARPNEPPLRGSN
jgi:hypothetical protein